MARPDSTLRAVAAVSDAVGRGMVAGAIGTACMTLSSRFESTLRGRPPSDAPAEAAGRVLGVQPRDEEASKRFATIAHYGTGWGAVRGLLDVAGVEGWRASVAHFGAVRGTALVMLPALDVAPPASEWGGPEIGIDALHHAVYAAGTSVAYQALTRA